MRRSFILLLIALFLSFGTLNASADRHHNERPRHEQQDNHGKKKTHKPHKPSKPHRHNKPKYGRPGVGHPSPPAPPRLPHMVRHITNGCHDVNVWQISHDTYIVKYRKGNRLYTRKIYPYSQKYGKANLISVNWRPQSPWTLIPSIQLNINL